MTPRSAVAALAYPSVMAGAIGLFAALLGAGAPLPAVLYVPIATAGCLIVLIEWLTPEKLEWRPRWREVGNDALFLGLVQVALPRLLAMALALGTAAWLAGRQSVPWPRHWPLAAQVLLMVLAVDLGRYWLHRACHSWPALWRLHEVHHAPGILYTLNTARFHPLEKCLHFACDTVPFVLLGAGPQVLAGYFLLYAVNGFFQHSNIHLRYGVLNYLVGSAQTHRWHHARDARTALCNFGSSTVLWDLLFGTWYLPRRDYPELGIEDRGYPTGFWAQMRSPWRRRAGPRPALLNRLAALWLRLVWYRHAPGLRRALRDPHRAQRRVLRRILRANRATAFGRAHGFARVRSHADFARAVPVHDYEALRAYVDAQMQRGERALTAARPLRYLRTSGSTGLPKDIPATRRHLRQLRAAQRFAMAAQARLYPAAFAGGVLTLTSPSREGSLPGGAAYGSASGLLVGGTPRLARRMLVVPGSVYALTDAGLRTDLILRLALARPDLSYLGTANPSTLLALMRHYRAHAPELIEDLRTGGFRHAGQLPTRVRREVSALLRADPVRADELAALERAREPVRLTDLWPRLALVVTWTCASAGVAARALRAELGEHCHLHELGYLASELRGTVTLGRRAGSGLPTYGTHFFEFVERRRWERGEPVYLTLDQLRRGQDYFVIVTTPSGLYRYFMNDLVRVRGILHRMPLLEFRQKGRGVTSITGEKLYEAQALEAIHRAAAQLGITQRLAVLLADETEARYRLYVEADAAALPSASVLGRAVDAHLQTLNLEYRGKRASGRLGDVAAHWLRAGTDEAYRAHAVRAGQREGQFKPVALAYRDRFDFDLHAHLREPPPC